EPACAEAGCAVYFITSPAHPSSSYSRSSHRTTSSSYSRSSHRTTTSSRSSGQLISLNRACR
ncbi:MAG: hypothetical protein L0L28_08365, partial [Corynebacterium flavescens]|uniref:hypothetical protein n=1 Tax=Corynebacterium flavescens TaxID=28028 RepID=UPI0026498DA2